jgi:hypothetical protein
LPGNAYTKRDRPGFGRQCNATSRSGQKCPSGGLPHQRDKDVIAEDDDFFDQAIEGFVMFALNPGEVHLPSRALIHESIYERFMARAGSLAAITQGEPRSPATMIGPQASGAQMEKILSYVDIGKKDGALQAVGHRPRDPQDDARPLPADQESPGQLQPEEARILPGSARHWRHDASHRAANPSRRNEISRIA